MRTIQWRHAAGFAAVAAPILMWAEFLSVGLTRSGYNLLTRPFSDLATIGTQNSTQFDVGFFLIPGALTVVVGIGLFTAHLGRLWKAGAILVVGAGAFLFLTGVFRQDPTVPSAGILHGTVSQICFALASLAPALLFIGSAGLGESAPPRRLWLAVALASPALELFGVIVRPAMHIPYGLFQRPFTLALTIFFATTAFWLLTDRRLRGLSVRD